MAEDIGGVSIAIDGDFSPLEQAFSDAAARAQQQGAALASAIQSSIQAPDTSGVTSAISAIGDAAEKQAAPLDALGQKVQDLISSGKAETTAEALAMAIGQMGTAASTAASDVQPLAAAVKNMGDAASQAAPTIQQAGQSAQTAGQSAQTASAGFGDLAGALLKIAGFSLTVGGVVSFAESMGEAFDSITKAQVALTALTGSASTAADMIQRLDDLGVQDGLAMPGLLQAAERMTNMLPPGTDIVGILSQLADAAAVTGGNIDGMSSKFDRLVESSTLSAKTLQGLGLNMDNLKQAMDDAGVDLTQFGDDAKTAWANLDAHDKIVVVQTDLLNLQGIAAEVADNTFSGKWAQAAAEWHKDLGTISDDFKPLFDGFGSLRPLVDTFAAGLVIAATGIKTLVDQITDWVAIGVNAISGMATAMGDVAKGNFAQAAADIKDAFVNISAAGTKTGQDLVTDLGAGVKTVTDLMNQSNAAIKPNIDSLDGLGTKAGAAEVAINPLAQATHALADNMTAILDPARNSAVAMDALASNVDRAQTSLAHAQANLNGAVQSLEDLKASSDGTAASAVAIEQAENNVAIAAGKAETAQKSLVTAQTALDTAWGTSQAAAAAMNEALSQAAGEALTAQTDFNDLTGALGADLPSAMSASNQAAIDFGIKVADMGQKAAAFKASIDQLIGDLPALAGLYDSQRISLQQYDDALGKVELSIQKMAKDDLPGAIAEQQAFIDQLKGMPGTFQMIQQSTESMLQEQIKWGEMSGQSVGSIIIALDQMKAKQQEVAASAAGWGTAYTNVTKDIASTFQSLNQGFADAIVSGTNLGDVLNHVFDQVEKKILTDVISGALKPLESELVGIGNNSGVKATSKDFDDLGNAIKAGNEQLNSTADGLDSVDTAMGSVSATTKSATSSFGAFASTLSGTIALMAAAFEAGKSLGEMFNTSLDPSVLATTNAMAGLNSTQISNLSKTLGVDLTGGGAVTALMGPSGTPSAETLANAVQALKDSITNLETLQTTLTNEMIAAYSVRNTQLGDQLSSYLKTISSDIQTEQTTLTSIDGSTKDTSTAQQNVAATTQQMYGAIQAATDQLNNLRLEQSSLENQILIAESQGNTTLVQTLESQLGTVNSNITSQSTLLTGITSAVQQQAPQIVAGFSLLQQALQSGNTSPDVVAAIWALENALRDGNIDAISQSTVALQAIIGTGTTAVVAAVTANNTQSVVAPIISGFAGMHADSATVAQAIQNEQATINGLTSRLNDLNAQLVNAVASGNIPLANAITAQINTTNSDLSAANSTLSAIQVNTGGANDLISKGFTGVQASGDQTISAINNLNTAINTEHGLISDLEEQLKIALADGNTDLVTKIQAAITTVNGMLSSNNTLLQEISGSTATTATNTTTPVPVSNTPTTPSPLPVSPVTPPGPGSSNFSPLSGIASDPAFQMVEIAKQIADNEVQMALALTTGNQKVYDQLTAENGTLNDQLSLLKNPPSGPQTAAIQELQAHIASDIQSMITAQLDGDAALAAQYQTAIDKELGQLQALKGGVDQSNLDMLQLLQQSIAAANSAQTTADKIGALNLEMHADQQLAINAAAAGNDKQAQAYRDASSAIADEIRALQNPLAQIANNTAPISDLAGAMHSLANGPLGTNTPNQAGNAGGKGIGGNMLAIPQYQTGGYVPNNTLAFLDAGEYVLNPQQAADLGAAQAAPNATLIIGAADIASFKNADAATIAALQAQVTAAMQLAASFGQGLTTDTYSGYALNGKPGTMDAATYGAAASTAASAAAMAALLQQELDAALGITGNTATTATNTGATAANTAATAAAAQTGNQDTTAAAAQAAANAQAGFAVVTAAILHDMAETVGAINQSTGAISTGLSEMSSKILASFSMVSAAISGGGPATNVTVTNITNVGGGISPITGAPGAGTVPGATSFSPDQSINPYAPYYVPPSSASTSASGTGGDTGGLPGISSFGPGSIVPSFDLGGPVGANMVARLHAGEEVLPPDLARMLRRMASLPGTGPSTSAAAQGYSGPQSVTIPIAIYQAYDPDKIMRDMSSRLRTFGFKFAAQS